MIVRYRCPNGHEFDGHWHHAEARRKQFPELKWMSDHAITEMCPTCGLRSNGKNIESDEDFTPYEPSQVDEGDMTP